MIVVCRMFKLVGNQDGEYGSLEVGVERGNCVGVKGDNYVGLNVGQELVEPNYNCLDDELLEPTAEDFEVIEDTELCLCDSDDEENKICDFCDEEILCDMYKNIMFKEFKYKPDGSVKLVKGHAFLTLEFF